MIFGGFQKLTLLDFPGFVACTLFTKGCNFLCPFCHNAPLVNKPGEAASFSEEEILSFLKKRTGILEGVCITGGEPLLHTSLKDFIIKVKALGYKVKLDTNGSFPERLSSLISEGLIDYVAMDIKNSFEKYAITSGTDKTYLPAIEESIDILLSGKMPYEFRTTVTRELHTVRDIELIAERINGADKYFLQNFSDSGNIIGRGLSPVDELTLKEMSVAAAKYIKFCKIR
ncbi:MAG: anaerobic ribonucleoside-triphosphate reductase activating protein [Clostridia bacterium]|nr:anaerobic ribonucleoside-triphosphate reductase activating protein [Clostridia bacterium]